MPDDRKRKRAKKSIGFESSDEFAEVHTSESLNVGFTSNAVLPNQRFVEPPLQLPLSLNIDVKQEYSGDESDDSTETVIRGETNSSRIIQECENISPNCHQQHFDQVFIKAEDLKDDSSKSQKNADVTQSDVYSVDSTKSKQNMLDTACTTSITLKDSFDCQIIEQIKESDKTLFNADRSSKSMRKTIKTEPVTFSSPATTVEENRSPIKPFLHAKLPNSLNDSQHGKDQNHSFPDKCEHIANRIKKEPVFPEGNKLTQHTDVSCPQNVMNSSLCSSADKENPLKHIHNFQSPLFDPSVKFSMDSARFLSNIDFTLEDITESISYISGRYLSGGNLEDISTPLNAFRSIPCVSIPNFTDSSISVLKKFELTENADHISCISTPSTSEPSSKDILKDLSYIRTETPFINKQFKLEENQIKSTSTNLSEESTGLEDTTKNLRATTKSDINESNFEKIPEKFQKSMSENSNNFVDKGLSEFSSSFTNEKWKEILHSAGSILASSSQGHEYTIVTNDSLPVPSKDSTSQVKVVASKKKRVYEDFDIGTVEKNNTFFETEIHKHTHLSVNSCNKQKPSLPKTVHFENTEPAELHKLNKRNLSNSKETSVKKLKITEYKNKCTKLQTLVSTLMEQNVEVIGNATTQTPVTNDSLVLSSKDSFSQSAVSSKRQVYEDFDKDNTFKTKIHKRTHLSKSSYRDEGPSLLQTARSEDTKNAGLHKSNNRNLSDCGETTVKRLKTAEYQNKCTKQQTLTSTRIEQKTEVAKNTSTQSLLASFLTSDRVRPSTSFVLDGCKQNVEHNQKSARDIYSQNDAVPRDPRLHRNKSSIPASVISPGSQTGTTGMVSPIHSNSKQIVMKLDVQNYRSSHITDTIQKSYHHHDDASRNQKGHRSSSKPLSYSHNHASTPSSSGLHSSQSIAHARKVQTKAGKIATPVQDVSFHIIRWDTMWLEQMKENIVIPQICKDTQPAQESYESFSEYYNTFSKLHLLSIFLDIYESWNIKSDPFCAKFESDEQRSSYYKTLCNITVRIEDMPITPSIIHITRIKENGEQQCFFGFVYDVKQRIGESPLERDVMFSFYTAERLWTKGKFKLHVRKLSRMRIAIKQLSALKSFESSPMKNVLLNSKKHSRAIEVFEIPSTAIDSKTLEPFVIEIVNSAMSPDNQFTLVVQPSDSHTLAITKILASFLPKRFTVLVCLRDTERCFDIAESIEYGFVLALKESEITDIPENLKEFTLRGHASKLTGLNLEAAEMEVLRTAKIILTVTSRIFLGDNKNTTLGQKLTVIIEHSTMCTELETALPLSYRPENVVLLGDPKIFLKLHRHLNFRDYHKSLFHRLFEARKKT